MDASTSTSVSSSNDEKACGYSKLAEGKRHLLVGDVSDAASSLALASELLAKQFGETHLECADAYFYYGKSLLDLARIENGVLGNALEGVPEGGDIADDSQVEDPEKMSEEERSAVEDKVKEALDYNYQTCEVEKEMAEAAATEEVMDGEETTEEGDDAMEQEPVPVVKDVAMDESTTEDKSEDAAEGEPGNLQQAWEMFELAKMIYSREVSNCPAEKKADVSKKICDSLLHLGEISMENENYDQALEDLGECLKLREASLPADSRSIAETHYQLGLAQAQSEKFAEGEASFARASEVLKIRLANLQKMESSDFLSKEIADLTDLIKEVNEKATDFEDLKTQVAKKLKGISQSGGAEDKPVASIAIKRREEKPAEAAAAM